MPVRIQEHDFDLTQEIALLRKDEPQIGAVAIFIGTVRDLNEGSQVKAMTLEHYPGMTEKLCWWRLRARIGARHLQPVSSSWII